MGTILFFFGPLSNVVTMIPTLSRVNVNVDNLQRLEAILAPGPCKIRRTRSVTNG